MSLPVGQLGLASFFYSPGTAFNVASPQLLQGIESAYESPILEYQSEVEAPLVTQEIPAAGCAGSEHHRKNTHKNVFHGATREAER